jgi:hypothetical protein
MIIGTKIAKKIIGRLRRFRVERIHNFSRREQIAPSVITPVFGELKVEQLVESAFTGNGAGFVNELWRDHVAWGGCMDGQYDYFDMIILFYMVDRFDIRKVVECSPHKGWSTTIIQKAMQGRASMHRSYDIIDYERRIKKDMSRHVHPHNWEFILGDFRKTIDLEMIGETDLLFIDSDHSLKFAEWYLDEAKLPNRARPGSVIAIHDIYPQGKEPNGFGESPYVLNWLKNQHDEYDVFWTYEASRMNPIIGKLPGRVFADHNGNAATNCSLWLYKKKSD